jgi:membrane-associated phospholipid phosphatase
MPFDSAQVSGVHVRSALKGVSMHRFLVAAVAAWLVVAPEVTTAQELSEVAAFRTLFVPTTTLGSDDALAAIQNVAPANDEPPIPHRTGFRALGRETRADFISFPRRPSTWVILGAGAAAAALGHLADDDANDRLVGSDAVGKFFAPGKWIGSAWAQGGTSVGLYLVGRYLIPPIEGKPRTNKVSHLGMDLLRAQILSQAFIHTIKFAVRRDRPTGECCAFPSGHSASAFAAASVLERHFGGYRGAWPTLLMASYVAMSRLHDNRHFVSDVVFGAAIGVGTGWTIVGRHGRSEFSLVPIPVPGGMGLALARVKRPAPIS